jgi:hypothetical protein
MVMPLPRGICLAQYRAQARDLLKLAQAADINAMRRIQRHHPARDTILSSGGPRLVDCQLVIARELGYASWPKLKNDLVFRNAVAALDAGDLTGLANMLQRHVSLVSYSQHVGEWYEAGYFAGATLLHHVAGNPIRCPLPANILDITRLLLRHGADPNAVTVNGATTIELLLTSMQASEAGVAVPLIDLVRDAGGRDDLSSPELLSSPLLNAAPATAAALARRGAVMDIRHAAALGWLDQLATLLASDTDPLRREEALVFACVRGQEDAARLLVHHGASGDILLTPGGCTPRTALHEAANRGHMSIVALLLGNGADARIVEPHWGGTALGWAEEGGHAAIVALLEQKRAKE